MAFAGFSPAGFTPIPSYLDDRVIKPAYLKERGSVGNRTKRSAVGRPLLTLDLHELLPGCQGRGITLVYLRFKYITAENKSKC